MKNPIESLSNRSIKIIFTVIVLVVLALCTYNALSILYFHVISNDECAWRTIEGRKNTYVITDIVPGGVSDVAGLKNGDILLKINGKNFVTEPGDTSGLGAMTIVNAIPYGDYATYLIERDNRQFDVKVQIIKVINITYIANLLLGLGFLVVGYIVVVTKPKGKTQRMFGYYSIFVMLTFGLSNFNTNYIRDYPILFYLTLVILFITFSFSPAVFLNFFFYFPVYKKSPAIQKFLIVLTILSGAYVLALMTNFITINAGTAAGLLLSNIVVYFFVAGFVIFCISYFRLVKPDRRKPLRPILISSTIGILIYSYTLYIGSTNQFIIFIKPQLYLPLLIIVFVPISYGYSIFRYRLMDIDLIIKKSIIYAIVTAAIAAFYVLVVFFAGNILGELIGQGKNEALSIIAIIVIAFMFDPLKRSVQEWVDKVFYRERHNYEKALLEFGKNLPLQVELKQILNSVVETISTTMHTDQVAVVLFEENDQNTFVTKNVSEDCCKLDGEPNGIRSLLLETKETQSIPLLKEEYYSRKFNSIELDKMSESGIELSIPMLLQDRLIGVIDVGRKRSDRIYSQEDIDLLTTLAGQTAIAVENSRLYEKEKSLISVEQELKLASRIQLEWLPKSPPSIAGYDISGITTPAKIVGGDYFDFIEMDPRHLAICIGDVSGKGLPAAMMLAHTQAILKSQSMLKQDPKECIRQTNRILFQSTSTDMFVTLFYGILNTKDDSLIYTNAGHNYPILLSESSIKPVFLKTGGLILSFKENSVYEQETIKLKHGDLLVLYTDGITEEFNASGDQFGEDRLLQYIIKYRDLDSEQMIQNIMDEVNKFSSNVSQSDDMTMVVIKKKQ
jgi:sigma-B regulation protein RsbU (phosphoserine phosphatase)